MRNNIVLIDFENLQPESVEQLKDEHFGVVVFTGASQKKLHPRFEESLQKLGSRAERIQISGTGPNALDFHIAYCIGVLSVADPSAHFYIVSKDKGFDPLIRFLRTRKFVVDRVKALDGIRPVQAVSAKLVQERVQTVIDSLAQPKATKPRTVTRLANTISSLFHKQLRDEDVDAVIERLKKRGIISVDQTGKVTYALASCV